VHYILFGSIAFAEYRARVTERNSAGRGWFLVKRFANFRKSALRPQLLLVSDLSLVVRSASGQGQPHCAKEKGIENQRQQSDAWHAQS
jgi:hypothetical protein